MKFVDAFQCASLKCHFREESEMAHVNGWICDAVERDVSLPALKSLFINTIFFTYGDLCNVLLPGCPVLEELSVYMPGMSFDAPNLVSLDYSDYALEFRRRPDMSGLINGISNVHTLILTPASADVISRCVKHGLSLPVFKNLVGLSFRGDNKRCWKLLPYLIKHSPKLCTLIIHGLDDFTCDGTMHLVKVKVLHVLGGGGSTARELEHLMSILGGVMVDDGKILQTHDTSSLELHHPSARPILFLTYI
uniref:FBD domain-containing protein n=1 Tax=Brassica oleracea var. oleracea TaxID=109376 RepID=A0A0D3AED6_BRAOL